MIDFRFVLIPFFCNFAPMNKIACHIEYLLQGTDCVVVPSFGAFILQRIEARFDRDRQLFIPPTATLTFNPEINHNDGMLVSSVARAESVPYDVAAREVAAQVETIKAQLEADRHIDFGCLGSFNLTGESRIFTPARRFPILHNLDGLSSLPVSTVEMRAEAEENRIVPTPTRATVLRLDHAIRIAASIVIIVLIGLICSTPATIDDANMTYASVYPTTHEPEQVVEPGSTIVEPDIELIIAEVSEPQVENDRSSDIHFDINDPYILVVGSFDTPSQAKRFISSKPNKFKLEITENDGRFRVFAATGKSAAQATASLENEEFATVFQSAWPCRK